MNLSRIALARQQESETNLIKRARTCTYTLLGANKGLTARHRSSGTLLASKEWMEKIPLIYKFDENPLISQNIRLVILVGCDNFRLTEELPF